MRGGVPRRSRDPVREHAIGAESPPQSDKDTLSSHVAIPARMGKRRTRWRPTLTGIQEQAIGGHHDAGPADDGDHVRNPIPHIAAVGVRGGEFHERDTIPYSVRDTVIYQGVEINTVPIQ